ncbi:hypothetical protein GQ54DRAFT_304872 [Martensiomyces pterosporus]|nr:hypothetical protein GQ54DRAFT_304872 [Martensiomyces pterosporus]
MTRKLQRDKTTSNKEAETKAAGATIETQGEHRGGLAIHSGRSSSTAGVDGRKQAAFKRQRPKKVHGILRLWKSRRSASPSTPPARSSADSGKAALTDKDTPLTSSSASEAATAADLAEDIARREAAALVIQRAWRCRTIHGPVRDWQQAGITVDRVKQISFEDATRLMQSPAAVSGSSRLLKALLACVAQPDAHNAGMDGIAKLKFPGRMFVAGFLFATHPQGLATGNSHLDAVVESSAVTMTETYAHFESALLSNDRGWHQRLGTFVASYRTFCSTFESWKRSDTKELLSIMERHYLELDRLWQSVQRRTLGEGDEAWRLGIQAQRKDLVAKIRSLGGDQAVDELMRKQRELRATYSDPQPSQTPSMAPNGTTAPDDSSGHGIGHSPVINGVRALHVDSRPSSKSPDPQPRIATSNGTCAQGKDMPPLAISSAHQEPSATLTRAISDPQSHDVDRILRHFDLTASAALQDAKLAHELVLDPDLRLEPAASNTLAGSVQQAVARAFFDHIEQEIEAGNRDHVIRILSQLRLDLRTIISPANPLRSTLERELDPEWLAEQLKQGALNVREKFALSLRLIRSVCAPVRDDAVDGLAADLGQIDPTALASVSAAMTRGDVQMTHEAKGCVHALLGVARGIMELIRDIRLDVLNYQLQTIVRPWLLVHAVEYERSKMAQMLQRVCEDDGAIVELTTGQPRAMHVFLEAVLDLCFARQPLSAEATPATLALDRQRIHHMQNEIQVILSAAALGTLVKNLARQNNISVSDTELHRCTEEWLTLLRSDDVTMDRIVATVQKAASGFGGLADRLVRKTLNTEDPVFRVMEQRLRRFILAELDKDESPGALSKRLEEGSGAMVAELSRAGLGAVHKDVAALLLRISRLCRFNWQVHAKWYSRICL